jgi:hypothetical protein
MEPSRFDDLTKALATATSRRHAIKAIAATTLGGILGLSSIGTAGATQCQCLTKEEKACCDAAYPNDPAAKCLCRLQSEQGIGLCFGGQCICAEKDHECPPTTFTCTCNDLTIQSTCTSAICPISADVICTQTCVNNGGWTGGVTCGPHC